MSVNKLSGRGSRALVGLFAAAIIGSGVGVLGPAAEPASASGCRSTLYATGHAGWCVKQAQILLRGWDYHAGQGYYTRDLVADGIFGPKTRAAVVKYQGAMGLVKDGIIGPKTWHKLCNPGFGGGGTPDSYGRAWNKAHAAVC